MSDRKVSPRNRAVNPPGPSERMSLRYVPLTIGGNVAVIHLTRGLYAICDLVDWLRLPLCKFNARKTDGGATWYPRTTVGMRDKCLHNFILPTSRGMVVDHINRNGLDNRKSNLRIATRSLNSVNWKRKNKWGYRGVRRQKSGGFQVSITIGGRRTTVGTFPTLEAAARAYDVEARRIHGEFAVLNFPDQQHAEVA